MAGLATLFDPAPGAWGLRGDLVLWDALREGLRDQPVPGSEAMLLAMLGAAFGRIVGQGWQAGGAVAVPALVQPGGGMSNGMASLDWWRDSGVPLIVARWRADRGKASGGS